MKAKGLPYFKDIVRNYYVYLDEMIGRFMELAPKDTTFIIVSDHGFKTHTKGKPGHERKIAYHEPQGITGGSLDHIPDEIIHYYHPVSD